MWMVRPRNYDVVVYVVVASIFKLLLTFINEVRSHEYDRCCLAHEVTRGIAIALSTSLTKMSNVLKA